MPTNSGTWRSRPSIQLTAMLAPPTMAKCSMIACSVQVPRVAARTLAKATLAAPPIVILDGNKHIHVGVVYWGYGCAQESYYPGVYARVSSTHDWIKGVVCDGWDSDASFCDGGSGGGGSGGSGGGGGGGDTGGNDNCVTLTIDLLTDDYGSETEFFLVTSEDGEQRIWDENDFRDNKSHQFSACLDPTGCATLNIFDSYGDGIFNPDGITLSYDGNVVYDSGDFGYGEVFNFGDACASGGGGCVGGDTGGNDDCGTSPWTC
jgi:hypothetical protein